MKRIFIKYNHKKRLEIITSCLVRDAFYRESKGFPFNKMYYYTNQVIEMYGRFSFHNPIPTIEDSFVYFKPQKAHINREGLLFSEIKYATHFITRKAENHRCCDGAKIRSFNLIKHVIENADIKFDFKKGDESKCYLVKRIRRNDNIIICCLLNPNQKNYYKVLTFLPNQSERDVLKKTTPAQ